MLANDAYWLTHHDYTGELRTSARAAGLMVAAALIGELVEELAVSIRAGQLVAFAPSRDALGAEVVRQIAAEDQRYPLDQWLEYLSSDACRRVGRRLVIAGAAQTRRTGFRRHPSVVARDGDTGPAWVTAGLINAIRVGQPLDDRRRFLLRLAEHSSIGRTLFAGADAPRAQRALHDADRVWPPWQELIDTAVRSIRDGALTR